MSDQLNDIRLTISWKNISNFDTVKRIKFIHRFNNQDIKNQIIHRPNDDNDPFNVFFTVSDTPVQLYSDIPRERQYIGDHEVSVYFSFDRDLDLWIDLLGNVYAVNITEDNLSKSFSEQVDEKLILRPKMLDNSPLYSLEQNVNEYVLRLRKNDTALVDKHVRLLATTIEGGFKLYHINDTGVEHVVEWMTYDDTGSITWVDNFNDAKTFYRVKVQALVPGTDEKYDDNIMFLSSATDIKSASTRVLYKHPQTQEVLFVRIGDIKISFDDAFILFTDASSATNEMIRGSKEIEYDIIHKTNEVEGITVMNPRTWSERFTGFDLSWAVDCHGDCYRNPSCMGYKKYERTWHVSDCVFEKNYGWSRCDKAAGSCEYYLIDEDSSTPKHKTTNIDGYKRFFYTGVGQ